MDAAPARPSLASAIFYKDPWKALDWLEQAFGFERTMVISDNEGNLGHAQMSFGNSYIMIGSEGADFARSPQSIEGKNTQILHVHLDDGVDGHCERAREAGAEILQEPSDQFYGDRTYRARDLEGHVWTFGQHVRDVSRDEAAAASGLNIEGWA